MNKLKVGMYNISDLKAGHIVYWRDESLMERVQDEGEDGLKAFMDYGWKQGGWHRDEGILFSLALINYIDNETIIPCDLFYCNTKGALNSARDKWVRCWRPVLKLDEIEGDRDPAIYRRAKDRRIELWDMINGLMMI